MTETNFKQSVDVYCPFVLNCNFFCSIECAELDDLLAVLEEGLKNRAIGTHNMNEHSSRSHTILTVHIHRWEKITLFTLTSNFAAKRKLQVMTTKESISRGGTKLYRIVQN